MTLTVTSIISNIQRHLSVIGKRLYSKEGKNLFSNITLSSAETDILKLYVIDAAQDVEAALKQFITACSISGTDITINIANTRGDSDFDTRTKDMTESYIVTKAIEGYLSMVHSELSAKYTVEARNRMEALLVYVYYKKPPIGQSETLSFTDPTGVFNENGTGDSTETQDDNTETQDDNTETTEQDNN